MSDAIWELVLVSPKGQVLARALELGSEDRARDMAAQWNNDRSNYQIKGLWVVSRLEGRVA